VQFDPNLYPCRKDACQIGSFDLTGLFLDLLECRLPGRKVETGAGGGSHRLQIVFQIALAPVPWRTGVTSSRQLAGAEYLDAMVRLGNEYPRVGSGNPVRIRVFKEFLTANGRKLTRIKYLKFAFIGVH
jgi:hypothetical protein